ncbi:hypothetical protein FZZ91_12365 [Synechococcus sp. HB1133]|uniref:hypothetical protein n=1 Tax=unclassified Synechococcus TaxID=2626047 RepID=UPI00140C85F8|nr:MULTISPECIES: hypothetical protein [unclassified Synechococcus]MCB4423618.1 hypothetical protein [Synechococcus sp. HB1133]MCB4431758.1 hypothetical protein [Synechococcus sp. HBA1120]NHI82564.1 hypothetical protein [Synechococcus sp. HB1133]
MTRDTRIALSLLGEIVAALRANDPDLFKRWLYGGIEDLGEPAPLFDACKDCSRLPDSDRWRAVWIGSALRSSLLSYFAINPS